MRFKTITAAYDELKSDETRDALRAEIMGDVGNEAWRDQRQGYTDTQDVSSEFDKAEAKANAKGALRGMYTFEALVHPRVLFVAVPLLMLAVYTVKAVLFGTQPDAYAMVLAAEDTVDAWLNPATGRYETVRHVNATRMPNLSESGLTTSPFPFF